MPSILGLKNTIIAVIITAFLGYFYAGMQFKEGIKYGKDSVAVEFALRQDIIDEQRRIALEATAKELSKIEVKSATIYNKTIKEVQSDVVYRDCKLTPSVLQSVREATSAR